MVPDLIWAPDFFGPQEIWAPKGWSQPKFASSTILPYNDFYARPKFLRA